MGFEKNLNPIKYPQCFIDKISFDQELQDLKHSPVVSFLDFVRLKHLQNTARMRCRRITSYNTTGPSGTPMAMRG